MNVKKKARFVARFNTNNFILRSFLYRASQLVQRVERLSLACFFRHCKARDKKNWKIGDRRLLHSTLLRPTNINACIIESLINFWNCSAWYYILLLSIICKHSLKFSNLTILFPAVAREIYRSSLAIEPDFHRSIASSLRRSKARIPDASRRVICDLQR